MKGIERRRWERYPCRLRVRFGSVQELREQYITNMGEAGVFVETLYPLRIGALVDLEMLVGEDPDPLKVRGEVMWVKALADGGTPGMGVRFLEMPGPVNKRWARLMRHAPSARL